MTTTDRKTNDCSYQQENNTAGDAAQVGLSPLIQEAEARSIGNLVQRMRREVGLSTHALARLAGVDKAVITKLEKKQGAGVPRATVMTLLNTATNYLASELSAVTGKTFTVYRSSESSNDRGVA